MSSAQNKSTKVIHTYNQKVFGFAKLLMGALKIDRMAKLRDKYPKLNAFELVDRLLDEIGVSTTFKKQELENIPTEGSFIVVANHPMGGIDGLLLLKLIGSVRPDVKILANFMLSSLKQIDDFFIPIHDFDAKRDDQYTFASLGKRHLDQGGGLVVFPAGTVSSYNLSARAIKDRIWKSQVIDFVHQSGVPIIPVFIRGSNKLLLHMLNTVNPRLLENALPVGVFAGKEKEIKLRIGKPLRTKEVLEFTDSHEFGRYLRAKVYMLGSGIKVKPFFRPILFKKKWKSVVLPRDVEAMKAEIEALRKYGSRLHESKDFEVFWAQSEWIPNILFEIGRLREITFRQVGEGTGKNIDLDEYDLYYRHLFIWDKTEDKLVGAYRLGMGKEIMTRLGKRGFYLNSLFSMRPSFDDVLRQSIELGRSFVAREYQLKPLSLFLLWKGILYFILKHPEYRYLIGPVSISGEFSKVSKYLIISFIKSNYFDNEMAALVAARNEYIPEVNVSDPDVSALRQMAEEDIKKLDRVIEEIEMGNFRLPALLKKYLGQNARIIAFNVDPKFNNALDGFLVMDLFNVPPDTLHGLAKEFGDKDLLEKYTNRQDISSDQV